LNVFTLFALITEAGNQTDGQTDESRTLADHNAKHSNTKLSY